MSEGYIPLRTEAVGKRRLENGAARSLRQASATLRVAATSAAAARDDVMAEFLTHP